MIRGAALAIVAVFGSGVLGNAQERDAARAELTEIQHSPAPCMDTETFPMIEARAASPAKARRLAGLTLRFRAEGETGWYETEFRTPTGTVFQAALPKPTPDAARVAYFFMTGEHDRRTREYLVPVLMGGCPGARSAPTALTDAIRVRRLSADQSEVPTGFSPDGISAGSSLSRATIGIVAAAGGGAGVAALVMTGDEPAPSPGNPGTPEAVRACFTPDPIPDINSGDTVLFDASCTTPATVTSYLWNFGDGTTAQGSSVEHRFIPGGIYSVTLSASDGQTTDSTSRLVRVLATPSACFITNPDPPRIAANESINFNAECSVGDRDGGASAITRYEWDFGDGRPGAEGVFVSRQFAVPDVYGVRLTVTNADGRQGSNTQFIVVENRSTGSGESSPHRTDTASPSLVLTTELELEETSPRDQGHISLNDSEAVTTTASAPQQHRLRGRTGDNVIEARLLGEAAASGRWRFDFSAAPNFEPGSLRVEAGDVLALDRRRVVFRLTRKPGAFVRFRFRLRE